MSNAAGPSDATGVVVTDTLPPGLSARSAVTDLGTCALGPPVSCDIGTLFVGATATVTITADVGPDTPVGTVTNDASVAAASIDPDVSNNTGTATTTVTGEADLDVNKTGTPVVPGVQRVLHDHGVESGIVDRAGRDGHRRAAGRFRLRVGDAVARHVRGRRADRRSRARWVMCPSVRRPR